MKNFLSLQSISIKDPYVIYHGNCIFSIWRGLYVIFMFFQHSVPRLNGLGPRLSAEHQKHVQELRSTLKVIRSPRLYSCFIVLR